MRNVKIPGSNMDVGKSQGYEGISVLGTKEVVTIDGVEKEMLVCKVVYELTPEEKSAMLEGGRIVLTLLGPRVQPHRLEVQSV